MNPITNVHRAAALFGRFLLLAFLPGLVPIQSGSRPQSAPVSVARILGQVLGADGKPAAGAVVHAIAPKRSVRTIPIAVGHALPEAEDVDETSVVADREGRFKLECGEFEWFGLWGERGADASSLTFPVAAGDTVVVRLGATRTVEGKVVPDGAGDRVAAAGARVTVDMKPAQIFGYNWSGLRWPTWSRTVESGADGAFSLRVPASASVSAIASLGGRTSAMAWQDPTKNEPLRLVLAAPGTLRGTVIDEKTRAPVAGALVRWRYGEHATCVTDAEGRFALSPIANNVEILVISSEHVLTAVRPTPEQLGGAPIEMIALARGLRLHARLLRDDGTPLTGSRLAFATQYRVQPKDPAAGGSGGSVSFPGMVGADGAVHLGWLQPGVPVNAYVEVDGSWASFHWSRPTADVTLGDVRVSATAALEGTVLGHDGTPVAAAAVRVLPQVADVADRADGIGTQWIGVVTNRAGRFRIGGLAPGRYRIGALAPAEGLVVAEVETTAAPRPLVLRAPNGESVDGKVLDTDDRPLADAWVTLRSAAPNRDAEALWFHWFWCRSGADGKFAFRGLPEGSYTLQASATVPAKNLVGQSQSVTTGEKDVTVVLEERNR